MNCRICLGITNSSYLLKSKRHNLTVQTFYCPACDAFFSDGGPVNYDLTDLTGYYLPYEQAIRARYQKIFYSLEKLVSPGRFLDIGAGMGYSLEVANERGWTATGIEPNLYLAGHAKGRGLNISNRYLNEETTGEYDFILIDNVLEHIHSPSDFLGHAVRILAKSGIMLVAVPPMDWLRERFGAISYVRDHITLPQLNIFGEVDEHVNIFSRKAMGRLLQGAGLRLLNIRFHHSSLYNNAIYRGLRLDDGYYLAVRA